MIKSSDDNEESKSLPLQGGNWMKPSYNPKYESWRISYRIDDRDRERRSKDNMYAAIAYEHEQNKKINGSAEHEVTCNIKGEDDQIMKNIYPERRPTGCFNKTIFGLILINFIFGGISVNYVLSWFGKNIPFIADIVIGIFVGEFTIPVALIGWILKLFGVF